jgi:CheY-like chemotaxis protein
MSKPGRILIVDDEPEWGKELAAFLGRNGFSANAVTNVAEALEQLNNTFYHVVVLDIRLPDDTEGGMGLLKELSGLGLKEATKVMMLSGYGTQEQMRQAFKDHEVADFIAKENTDPKAFLKSVQQVFEQKMKINLALDIRWEMRSRVEQVVSNLIIDGKRVGRNTALRRQLSEELDDLFCRLFHDAETILVRPLTQGWSGAGVVLVQPFFNGRGRGEDVIVKFGDMDKIKEEHNNFQQYVRGLLRGRRSTAIQDLRYTPHLGGIIYSLLGADNDQLVDFTDFYRGTDDISKIADVMDHLFQKTCANWYENRSQIQPLDLATEYQQFFNYAAKNFERIIARHLPSVRVREKLTFDKLNSTRQFTNPFLVAKGLSLMRFTSTCITHGDFNPHNVFVDQSGSTWLIDFQATRPGHILRDFVMLDSVIRFQLLSAQEATLEERLRMEDVLCKAEHFSQMKQLAGEFTTDNPALAKAYAATVHLRTLAGNWAASNARDDISEYYIGLFYNALNTLQFVSTLDATQREHALLCASILADRLKLGH